MVNVRVKPSRPAKSLSRTRWALEMASLVFFFFVSAGFIVFVIAMAIYEVSETMVLNRLLPRPAAYTSEVA